MGRPSARVFDVVVSDVNKLHPVPCPSRVGISQLRVVGAFNGGDKAFSVAAYCRSFSSPPMAVEWLRKAPNSSNVAVRLAAKTTLREGDFVDLAGGNVGTYNGTAYRILSVLDSSTVVLNIPYTSDDAGGTFTVNIPPKYWPIYEFIERRECDADYVWRFVDSVGLPFVNQDPRNATGADVQNLYLKFSEVGDYRVSIVTTTSWY